METQIEQKPIIKRGGFAVERRARADVSISVGPVRVRFPQWAFWLAALLIIGFFTMQILSLKWTGKPVPLRGISGEVVSK